ncbi:MAG: ketosteroid isomerase family protein [Candidatus Bathyarchaeia archaeon]
MSLTRKKAVLGAGIVAFSIILIVLLLSFPSPPHKHMTQDENEVNQVVMAYYETLRDVGRPDQIDRIAQFFADDAVLSTPEGTLYVGKEMIRRFYEDRLRDVTRYDVKADLSEIEAQNHTATAVYDTKSIAFIRGWTTTTIDPPLRVFREKFLLVRRGNAWQIAGLVMLR